jgi:hypothetical protein
MVRLSTVLMKLSTSGQYLSLIPTVRLWRVGGLPYPPVRHLLWCVLASLSPARTPSVPTTQSWGVSPSGRQEILQQPPSSILAAPSHAAFAASPSRYTNQATNRPPASDQATSTQQPSMAAHVTRHLVAQTEQLLSRHASLTSQVAAQMKGVSSHEAPGHPEAAAAARPQ